MNLNGDPTTESSISRASARSRNSTLSRNQYLIKKTLGLQDLKPADVLIERFVAWKAIVNNSQPTLRYVFSLFLFETWLTYRVQGIADIENNTAKEFTKLAGIIQVLFRAGN